MRGKFVHIIKRYGVYFIKSFIIVFLANLIIRGTLLVINSNIPSLWDGVCIFVVGGLLAIFQPDKGALISIGTIALSVAFLFWHDQEIAAEKTASEEKVVRMYLGENKEVLISDLARHPVTIQVLNESDVLIATFRLERVEIDEEKVVRVTLTEAKDGNTHEAYFIPYWQLHKVFDAFRTLQYNFQKIQENCALNMCTNGLISRITVIKIKTISNPPVLLSWWIKVNCLETIACGRL